jgi:hypothetical protein
MLAKSALVVTYCLVQLAISVVDRSACRFPKLSVFPVLPTKKRWFFSLVEADKHQSVPNNVENMSTDNHSIDCISHDFPHLFGQSQADVILFIDHRQSTRP